eukprot:TRINITY_DN50_c0_g2_i1.p1 TRINITY_DN50_c0_g2~~TRINITY_DN50_c0_g2_i1.p1  ORF type:complete len:120 (+),score=38.80 TRINITY_DN50_c0_g2_i1:26-361(+)
MAKQAITKAHIERLVQVAIQNARPGVNPARQIHSERGFNSPWGDFQKADPKFVIGGVGACIAAAAVIFTGLTAGREKKSQTLSTEWQKATDKMRDEVKGDPISRHKIGQKL